MARFFWSIVHNCIVHPWAPFVADSIWVPLHAWSAEKAYPSKKVTPRSLVLEFKEMAQDAGFQNFFAVVDGDDGDSGASVHSSTRPNSAARNARKAHVQWEEKELGGVIELLKKEQ